MRVKITLNEETMNDKIKAGRYHLNNFAVLHCRFPYKSTRIVLIDSLFMLGSAAIASLNLASQLRRSCNR